MKKAVNSQEAGGQLPILQHCKLASKAQTWQNSASQGTNGAIQTIGKHKTNLKMARTAGTATREKHRSWGLEGRLDG